MSAMKQWNGEQFGEQILFESGLWSNGQLLHYQN